MHRLSRHSSALLPHHPFKLSTTPTDLPHGSSFFTAKSIPRTPLSHPTTGNTDPRPMLLHANMMTPSKRARKYPLADLKILYGLAAGRCAFPDCRRELILLSTPHEEEKQIGIIAHILPHSKNGPRSSASDPYPEKPDSYSNWILLCPTCHAIVDKQDTSYRTSRLREIKESHEHWIRDSLGQSMSSLTFTELEVAINSIVSRNHEPLVDFSLIPIEKKIRRNELSPASRRLISIGLMQSKQVNDFISNIDQVDIGFADRLADHFKQEYLRISSDPALRPDAIFSDLMGVSSAGKHDFASQAAGLALLVHFFESCDVFEK